MNKYQEALNNLKEPTDEWLDKKLQLAENFDEPTVYKHQQDLDLMQKLIEEHFDNPPLKFEDLKEDMWVWDDKNKLYVQIDEDFDEGNGNILVVFHEDSYNSNCERTKFEENRFYRREVQ